MLHSRHADHLRWQLWSLGRQTLPIQVLVVYTGTEPNLMKAVARICALYRPWCTLLVSPQETFRRAWALNVGIQCVPDQIPFVACVDVDFVFSANFCAVALELLQDNRSFVQCEPTSLPRRFSMHLLAQQWDDLVPSLARWRKGELQPGAFQATLREWFFEAHGYDERYVLDGMDNDLQFRAHMSGLITRWIPLERAQALHMWHEASSFKHTGENLIHETGRTVTANQNGWGNL